MAITLNTPLPTYFSRNAVDLQFSCPDKFETVGAYNTATLIFTANPEEGDTLTIAYTYDGVDYEREFTFADSPDPDAYELPSFSGTMSAWVQLALAGLQSDARMAEHWQLGYHDDDPTYGIRIRALVHTAGNIEITPDGFTCTLIHAVNAAVPSARKNYRMTARLYLSDGPGAEGVGYSRTESIELDPDSSGTVRLNLMNYLKDMLREVEAPPTSIVPAVCTRINRPAYVLYGQKWGEPVEVKKQYRSPVFRVLKGGLVPWDFVGVASTLDAWLESRYLTLRHTRRVGIDQDDYLFWYCGGDYTTVKVRVRIVTESASTQFDAVTFISPTKGRTYKFKVNPRDLLEGQPVSPPINDLRVWVVADDEVKCEMRYAVSDDYLDVVFEYENSLGGIEAWKFHGERAMQHETRKANYETVRPFGATVGSATLRSYAETDHRSLSVHTGPLTAEEAAALPDFLNARHVWVIGKNGERVPVRIPEGKSVAEKWSLDADYTRGTAFTVEIGKSSSVSNLIL